MSSSGKLLSVRDVATHRGTHRVAARRWLSRNAKSYIQTIGKRVFISEEDYRRITEPRRHADLERRVEDLETGQRETTRRLDKVVEGLGYLNIRVT